ncbi:NADH:flavin oxidoreductase/NADH oxidase-like protein [Halenospora varia]|nr:NADH:flavin oxidoreductase/NADH oxidase-like protein [Halenospora varia]
MLLSEELALPCGLRFPNRLAKGAMAEGLVPKTHNPDESFLIAYKEWAEGGWGMVLTGNVQVSDIYLGQPGDPQVPRSPSPKVREMWKEWAATCQREETPTLVQLCHPGRQSPPGAGTRSFWTKTIAPSPVPLNLGNSMLAKGLSTLLFGTPKEMTSADVDEVVEQFVAGAKMSYEAGFKGVELHGAHGYLLAQFLSPATNHRNDAFGGTPAKRAEIVLRIIKQTRAATSPSFAIGIKLNSVDVGSSSSLSETLEQIALIVAAGIDFMEISGGTYEDPLMMQDAYALEKERKESTLLRESFFLTFAQAVRSKFPNLILMVTGGFRTRLGMEAALKSGGCDLIGIARPATIVPKLPKEVILNEGVKDEDANVRLKSVPIGRVLGWFIWATSTRSVGVGVQNGFYRTQIERLSKGLKPLDTLVR